MAAEPENGRLPAPSETIHLPDPSYVPIIVAAGVSIALIGVVFNPVVLLLGVLVTAVTTVRWVRDTRRDIAELPPEH
jgi:hypothetical protein